MSNGAVTARVDALYYVLIIWYQNWKYKFWSTYIVIIYINCVYCLYSINTIDIDDGA